MKSQMGNDNDKKYHPIMSMLLSKHGIPQVIAIRKPDQRFPVPLGVCFGLQTQTQRNVVRHSPTTSM